MLFLFNFFSTTSGNFKITSVVCIIVLFLGTGIKRIKGDNKCQLKSVKFVKNIFKWSKDKANNYEK